MIEVFTCPQNSDEWKRARMGIPTASRFATVMAKGRDGGASKTRREYLYKLLGERVTGEPMYSYSNDHMERGKEMETEARDKYAFVSDNDPEPIGFVRNGNIGCSPDSVIGTNGLVEIKTKLAHLQVEVLLSGLVPSEHTAQLQGQLWVCEREWVDFVSYWPKTRMFVKRVYRDEAYIKVLAEAVKVFESELVLMERVLNDQDERIQLHASIKAARAEAAA